MKCLDLINFLGFLIHYLRFSENIVYSMRREHGGQIMPIFHAPLMEYTQVLKQQLHHPSHGSIIICIRGEDSHAIYIS